LTNEKWHLWQQNALEPNNKIKTAQTCSVDPVRVELKSKQRRVQCTKEPFQSISNIVYLIIIQLQYQTTGIYTPTNDISPNFITLTFTETSPQGKSWTEIMKVVNTNHLDMSRCLRQSL